MPTNKVRRWLPQGRQPGFTLLEVLIALVILALAMTASYFSMSISAKNLLYLEEKTAGEWVALNTLSNVELGLINMPSNGRSSGAETMMNSVWYWELVSSETENPSVLKLNVNVKKSESSSAVIQMISYMFKGQ